jgi:hypothetical protein
VQKNAVVRPSPSKFHLPQWGSWVVGSMARDEKLAENCGLHAGWNLGSQRQEAAARKQAQVNALAESGREHSDNRKT